MTTQRPDKPALSAPSQWHPTAPDPQLPSQPPMTVSSLSRPLLPALIFQRACPGPQDSPSCTLPDVAGRSVSLSPPLRIPSEPRRAPRGTVTPLPSGPEVPPCLLVQLRSSSLLKGQICPLCSPAAGALLSVTERATSPSLLPSSSTLPDEGGTPHPCQHC